LTEKDIRIKRLAKREKERFGDRIFPGNDMYDNHQAFIELAELYEDGGRNLRRRTSEVNWKNEAKCKCNNMILFSFFVPSLRFYCTT
jgi:hypothetical protein